MSYISTDEALSPQGTDKIREAQMVKAEEQIKEGLSLAEKIKNGEIRLMYMPEEYPKAKARPVFSGVLLSCYREGERPEGKILQTKPIMEDQVVLAVGNNVDIVNVGDKVNIDVTKYQLRNMNAPVFYLEHEGEIYEYLLLSDRDIRVVYE